MRRQRPHGIWDGFLRPPLQIIATRRRTSRGCGQTLTSTPALTWEEDFFTWELPTITTNLADGLDVTLPSPRVHGYDYSFRAQPYHLEVWVEKTTMDDVLVPLCRQYGAVLVTGAGFQSLSSVMQLLQRVDQAGKPARIFYLSDFDPAGDAMPVAIARQIEFHTPQHAPLADIKLTPLGLTREQVQHYGLPRIPIKETDTRKTNFEDRYGAGAVELDALEALYPGELATMVRTALDPYVDEALSDRLAEAEADAQNQVDEAWQEATVVLRHALTALSTETETIYRRYQAILERLNARLQRELAPYQERVEALRHAVVATQERFLRLSSLRVQSPRYGLRMNPRGYSIVPGPILHNLPPIRPAATVHEERSPYSGMLHRV